MTRLDELTPQDIELAEVAAADLPLGDVAAEHFLELLADRLSWQEPDLAGKICGLSPYERMVLNEYLMERAGLPLAAV